MSIGVSCAVYAFWLSMQLIISLFIPDTATAMVQFHYVSEFEYSSGLHPSQNPDCPLRMARSDGRIPEKPKDSRQMRESLSVGQESSMEIRAVFVDCSPLSNNSRGSINTTADRQKQFGNLGHEKPERHDEFPDCHQKLIVTMKFNNIGKINSQEEFVVVDHVIDPITLHKSRLLNPYVIKIRQEPILQLYGLTFQSVVNGEATEQVLNNKMANYTGCSTGPDNPTCGQMFYNNRPIPYSQGFCCSCDAEVNEQRQPKIHRNSNSSVENQVDNEQQSNSWSDSTPLKYAELFGETRDPKISHIRKPRNVNEQKFPNANSSLKPDPLHVLRSDVTPSSHLTPSKEDEQRCLEKRKVNKETRSGKRVKFVDDKVPEEIHYTGFSPVSPEDPNLTSNVTQKLQDQRRTFLKTISNKSICDADLGKSSSKMKETLSPQKTNSGNYEMEESKSAEMFSSRSLLSLKHKRRNYRSIRRGRRHDNSAEKKKINHLSPIDRQIEKSFEEIMGALKEDATEGSVPNILNENQNDFAKTIAEDVATILHGIPPENTANVLSGNPHEPSNKKGSLEISDQNYRIPEVFRIVYKDHQSSQKDQMSKEMYNANIEKKLNATNLKAKTTSTTPKTISTKKVTKTSKSKTTLKPKIHSKNQKINSTNTKISSKTTKTGSVTGKLNSTDAKTSSPDEKVTPTEKKGNGNVENISSTTQKGTATTISAKSQKMDSTNKKTSSTEMPKFTSIHPTEVSRLSSTSLTQLRNFTSVKTTENTKPTNHPTTEFIKPTIQSSLTNSTALVRTNMKDPLSIANKITKSSKSTPILERIRSKFLNVIHPSNSVTSNVYLNHESTTMKEATNILDIGNVQVTHPGTNTISVTDTSINTDSKSSEYPIIWYGNLLPDSENDNSTVFLIHEPGSETNTMKYTSIVPTRLSTTTNSPIILSATNSFTTVNAQQESSNNKFENRPLLLVLSSILPFRDPPRESEYDSMDKKKMKMRSSLSLAESNESQNDIIANLKNNRVSRSTPENNFKLVKNIRDLYGTENSNAVESHKQAQYYQGTSKVYENNLMPVNIKLDKAKPIKTRNVEEESYIDDPKTLSIKEDENDDGPWFQRIDPNDNMVLNEDLATENPAEKAMEPGTPIEYRNSITSNTKNSPYIDYDYLESNYRLLNRKRKCSHKNKCRKHSEKKMHRHRNDDNDDNYVPLSEKYHFKQHRSSQSMGESSMNDNDRISNSLSDIDDKTNVDSLDAILDKFKLTQDVKSALVHRLRESDLFKKIFRATGRHDFDLSKGDEIPDDLEIPIKVRKITRRQNHLNIRHKRINDGSNEGNLKYPGMRRQLKMVRDTSNNSTDMTTNSQWTNPRLLSVASTINQVSLSKYKNVLHLTQFKNTSQSDDMLTFFQDNTTNKVFLAEQHQVGGCVIGFKNKSDSALMAKYLAAKNAVINFVNKPVCICRKTNRSLIDIGPFTKRKQRLSGMSTIIQNTGKFDNICNDYNDELSGNYFNEKYVASTLSKNRINAEINNNNNSYKSNSPINSTNKIVKDIYIQEDSSTHDKEIKSNFQIGRKLLSFDDDSDLMSRDKARSYSVQNRLDDDDDLRKDNDREYSMDYREDGPEINDKIISRLLSKRKQSKVVDSNHQPLILKITELNEPRDERSQRCALCDEPKLICNDCYDGKDIEISLKGRLHLQSADDPLSCASNIESVLGPKNTYIRNQRQERRLLHRNEFEDTRLQNDKRSLKLDPTRNPNVCKKEKDNEILKDRFKSLKMLHKHTKQNPKTCVGIRLQRNALIPSIGNSNSNFFFKGIKDSRDRKAEANNASSTFSAEISNWENGLLKAVRGSSRINAMKSVNSNVLNDPITVKTFKSVRPDQLRPLEIIDNMRPVSKNSEKGRENKLVDPNVVPVIQLQVETNPKSIKQEPPQVQSNPRSVVKSESVGSSISNSPSLFMKGNAAEKGKSSPPSISHIGPPLSSADNSKSSAKVHNLLAILEFMQELDKVFASQAGGKDKSNNDVVVKLERFFVKNPENQILSNQGEKASSENVVSIGEGLKHKDGDNDERKTKILVNKPTYKRNTCNELNKKESKQKHFLDYLVNHKDDKQEQKDISDMKKQKRSKEVSRSISACKSLNQSRKYQQWFDNDQIDRSTRLIALRQKLNDHLLRFNTERKRRDKNIVANKDLKLESKGKISEQLTYKNLDSAPTTLSKVRRQMLTKGHLPTYLQDSSWKRRINRRTQRAFLRNNRRRKRRIVNNFETRFDKPIELTKMPFQRQLLNVPMYHEEGLNLKNNKQTSRKIYNKKRSTFKRKMRQCSSDGKQIRGNQDCLRNEKSNIKKKNMESAHCLRFSDLWYSVYKLEAPRLDHAVYFQVFEKRTLSNGNTQWLDLTRGSMIRVGTLSSHQKDQYSTVDFEYTGIKPDQNEITFSLDHVNDRLLIPSPITKKVASNYPNFEGKTGEYLVVQKNLISENREECDKAGIGFAAFATQPDRCGHVKGTCLKNQPLSFWRHDMDARKDHKPGCYFLSNFAPVPSNPVKYNVTGSGSRQFLGLEYHSAHVSTIDIEVKADYNTIVKAGSSGRITAVYTDSTKSQHTIITVIISNMGSVSSAYQPRITNCPKDLPESWTTATGTMQVIPPYHDRRATFDLYGKLQQNRFHCSVELINHRGEKVATRKIRMKKFGRCFCIWHCLCSCFESVNGMGCRPMSPEQYRHAGFMGPVPTGCTQAENILETLREVLIFSALLIFFLLFLGILKWFVGLCIPCVGRWGLSTLLRGATIDQYFEPELRCRCVVTDEDGTLVHPDTGQRTVRICSRKLQFMLNLVFFLTYPIAIFCKCFKRTINSRRDKCCIDESKKRLIGGSDKMIPMNIYGECRNSRLEVEDTKYVMDELKRSKDSLQDTKKCKRKISRERGGSGGFVRKSSSGSDAAVHFVSELLHRRKVYRIFKEPIPDLDVPPNTPFCIRGFFLNTESNGYRFITPCPLKQHWQIHKNKKLPITPPLSLSSSLFTLTFSNAREVYESNELSLDPVGICINVQYLDDR